MNIFNQYEPTTNTLVAFLKMLHIKVTSSTVNDSLQQHPDYPSILCVGDSLKKWGVNNVVVKIDAKKLRELPYPCIAHVQAGGGGFVILTGLHEQQVSYVDWNNKPTTKSLDDFVKLWSGVVLLAETDETSGEKDYLKNRRKERWHELFLVGLFALPFILGALAIVNVSLSMFLPHTLWGFSLGILLKAIGMIVSVLLLWHEIDKSNPILQQVCTAGKKVNCDAVLDSKAAKLFPWLSWSEIGFFYFAGGFLALLFAGNQTGPILTLLAYLNVLALPYTVFSIFYQWRISKQWCMLCLSVQVLLVAEFAVTLLAGSLGALHLAYSYIALLFPAFILPVAVWYAMKPQLLAAQQGKRDFKQLQRIKYNSETFEALLQRQKKINVNTEGLGITLGNPKANISLVKVCNPYCGPCARAHKTIDALLESGNVKVQIIFTATNDEKDYRSAPTKHLLAIAARGDEAFTQQALGDWYGAKEKNYEAFALKYPANKEGLLQQSKQVEVMKKWCDEVKITFTPTFFVNGYQLPDAYNVDDLKYFLAE